MLQYKLCKILPTRLPINVLPNRFMIYSCTSFLVLLRTVRQLAFAQENTENVSIAIQFVVISVLLGEMVTKPEMGTVPQGTVVNTEPFNARFP